MLHISQLYPSLLKIEDNVLNVTSYMTLYVFPEYA